MPKLSDTAVKAAKAKEKQYKLSDGMGMYLVVRHNGQKFWLYQFRLNGKQQSYHIGMYPDLSLKKAREQLKLAREHVSQGIDPKVIKEERRTERERADKDFEYFFNEYLASNNFSDSYIGDTVQRMNKNVIPYLKDKSIDEHTTLSLYSVFEIIANRGAVETARRLASITRQVFDRPLLLGLIDTNPAEGLTRLLPKIDRQKTENFAHIDNEKDLSIFLRALNMPRPRQSLIVRIAIKLSILLFLRPSNLRFLRWEQIDWENKEIRIVWSEMKKKRPFIVPLAKQTIELLNLIKPLTGDKEYVFVTSGRKDAPPISENTINKAIRTTKHPDTGEELGKGFVTHHGFRHTASTRLNEMQFNPDIIEVQLAHVNQDSVRQTYNKAEWLPERHRMMQAWADYLDGVTVFEDSESLAPIN